MADAGASGEAIAQAMHDALALSGASEEEIAQVGCFTLAVPK